MMGLRLAAASLVVWGALGCGPGVDESKFAPTPGSPPPGAPQTPAELDAKTPKTKL